MKKPSRYRDNFPDDGANWQKRLFIIIFDADTPLGKLFDVLLLCVIVISVGAACLSTVPELEEYKPLFDRIELVTSILFTIEYLTRISIVKSPLKYMTSFFGIVDLLAILPLFVSPFFQGAHSFVVVRSLRLLRAFRVLGLSWLNSEAEDLSRAVWGSRAKIVVFLATVLIAVTIAGSAIYAIEGPLEGAENGSSFNSIPDGMYWAIVTMTTVGYGDIVPLTWPGKIVTSFLILLGYSLIIVPTGFVSAEIAATRLGLGPSKASPCESCEKNVDDQANFCPNCGRANARKR